MRQCGQPQRQEVPDQIACMGPRLLATPDQYDPNSQRQVLSPALNVTLQKSLTTLSLSETHYRSRERGRQDPGLEGRAVGQHARWPAALGREDQPHTWATEKRRAGPREAGRPGGNEQPAGRNASVSLRSRQSGSEASGGWRVGGWGQRMNEAKVFKISCGRPRLGPRL